MMECKAKHTKHQPNEEEFRCPKCGADPDGKDIRGKIVDSGELGILGSGGFVIRDPDPDSLEDCGLLHASDNLYCYACGYDTTGRSFANKLAKRSNLVTCPCCNGSGLTPRSL